MAVRTPRMAARGLKVATAAADLSPAQTTECDDTMTGFDHYLRQLGVAELPVVSCPFDPGIAPAVLESHLAQSGHLILSLKISMACWMIANPAAVRRKLAAAAEAGVATSAGGGPYEVAVAQGMLPA